MYEELKAVWERVLAVLQGSWQRNGKVTSVNVSYSVSAIEEKANEMKEDMNKAKINGVSYVIVLSV